MNTLLQPLSLFAAMALSSYALAGCATLPGAPEEATAETEEAIATNACPANVPAALTPDADQSLKGIFTGVGVQIYACNGLGTWGLVAPQANLLNNDGKLVGTHFIGPTWQSNDGSSVVAARKAGVTVDPSAIPWLLLTATSHNNVNGFFSKVTSIQRLSTVGGLAPTSVCDATNAGAVTQVPYSAEYAFYKTEQHHVKQCAPK